MKEEGDATGVIIIALGTGSAIKIEATQEAFAPLLQAGLVRIEPVVDAQSGVRPQPVGKEETCTGARNRALFAAKKCIGSTFAIGVENGMWDEESGGEGANAFVDGAFVVCVKVLHNNSAVASVSVEDEFVEESDVLSIPAVRPFPAGRNGEWSVLKDPHAVLTNGARPRKAFLVPPLQRIAQRIASVIEKSK